MHGCSWTHAVLLLLAFPLAGAQPWARCVSSSANYSAGSTYEANLLSLVYALQQNASSSPYLFASGSLGSVYGLMLCRGDISLTDCYDCGNLARRDAQTACRRRIRDVALCYNQCYVRLSDKNFLASTDNSGLLYLYGGNLSSSDVAGYNRAVTSLLNATVQYAVDNSTRLFATGEWVGPDPGFSHIYSVAQCAADLSPALCRSCLQDLVGQWWRIFQPNWSGARIAGSRCTLRSEVGPFYSGAPMLVLPTKAATPPPPGPAPTAAPGIRGGMLTTNSLLFRKHDTDLQTHTTNWHTRLTSTNISGRLNSRN
jgi:hypothetical protein